MLGLNRNEENKEQRLKSLGRQTGPQTWLAVAAAVVGQQDLEPLTWNRPGVQPEQLGLGEPQRSKIGHPKEVQEIQPEEAPMPVKWNGQCVRKRKKWP